MNTYRINEIFYSLQGEGRHTGVPAVFLRMAGCNMQCSFCDTQHRDFKPMTTGEIVAQVGKFPSRTVIVTGGEPALQLDEELTAALHRAGFRIHIETNGTIPLKPGAKVDWVTCSPKGSGRIAIRPVDELKVLFWGQDVEPYLLTQAKEYSLQPLDTGDAERNKEIQKHTIDYILNHPTWKLSLQTHKMLNVR